MKIVVIVLLVLAALVVGFFLFVAGFLLFSAISLTRAEPTRHTLLDTTFNGMRITFERLKKPDIGHTRTEHLLSLNGRFVWSSGAELEKNFRVTAHGVIPVHPEDLKKVVSIRSFPELPATDSQPSSFSDIVESISLFAVGSGKVLWLSPREVSEADLKTLGDFIESKKLAIINSSDSTFRRLDFPLFVEALVYADETLFAPRVYERRIGGVEETISIDLDGAAHFRRVDKNDITFGQPFGRLDSATTTLFVQLELDGVVRPLSLAASEIASFVNQAGEPLGKRYQVKLIETRKSSAP